MRWKLYDGPQISPMFNGIVCVISANERLIAVITEDETPIDPGEWPGIARLIAAAPDMLAALQSLVAKSTDTEGDWSAEWRNALDAIRKATGA